MVSEGAPLVNAAGYVPPGAARRGSGSGDGSVCVLLLPALPQLFVLIPDPSGSQVEGDLAWLQAADISRGPWKLGED
jgi:hypothetical protein